MVTTNSLDARQKLIEVDNRSRHASSHPGNSPHATSPHNDPLTTSPLRKRGRGALMAAAAAEQKGIVDAGGELPDQFANWRNVKNRVRAGGNLATMALQLQQTLGTPPEVPPSDSTPPESRSKRSAAAAGVETPAGERPKKRSGITPTKAARCQQRKPLPPKYAHLDALFRALESVCSLLALRKKACTFENVKKPLEDTTGRRFSLSNLAQLVGIYPEAFSLHYDSPRRNSIVSAAPGLLLNAPTSPPRAKFELRIDLQPVASGAEVSPDGNTEAPPVQPQEHSRRRVQGFRERLMRASEVAHRAFLDERGLEDPGVWHPAFDLNQVPDTLSAPLPTLPRSRPNLSSAHEHSIRTEGKNQTKTLSKTLGLSVTPPSSPSSPLRTRPALKIGSPSAVKIGSPRPPTPRSLARTFDAVAEEPASVSTPNASAKTHIGENGASPRRGGLFEQMPRGGDGGYSQRGVLSEHLARGREEGGFAVIDQAPKGEKRNPAFVSGSYTNPLRLNSASETGFTKSGLESGLRSGSSDTDSDCHVIGSEMSDLPTHPSTVWLRDGGRDDGVAAPADAREGGHATAAAAGLRGVPLDIVQQLAEREQRARVDTCPTAVAGRQRKFILAQLPGLVNQLRAIASAEGRCVLRKEQLLAHLVKGNPRSVDQGELTAQLSLLQELVPGFLSSAPSAATTASLLRINVKANFAALKKTLAKAT